MDHAAFETWLDAEAKRRQEFSSLTSFLATAGVGDVVPAWSLLREDAGSPPWCDGAGFSMPPRAEWRHIVPALRLVRDKVIPAVGRVELRSGYRTPALNSCVRGAPKSRHLSFSAVDLVALDQPDPQTTFAKLCAAWTKAGQRSGWGLGAYFDPARATANGSARFHIDGAGWRTWGFSKKSASSGCRFFATPTKR